MNPSTLSCVPLLCWLAIGAGPALALTPDALYRAALRQTFAVETRDDADQVVNALTAIGLAAGRAVTQCEGIDDKHAIWLVLDKQRLKATLAERDELRNLCMLTVPGLTVPQPFPIAEADPQPGTRVYALGNTLGLGIGISEGVISAIRTWPDRPTLQFTAPIGPGSQGGALIDEHGQWVGVIHYRAQDGQNVNFAAPARWVAEIPQRTQTQTYPWRANASKLETGQQWPDLLALAQDWSRQMPNSSEAHLWLGWAHEKNNDPAEAVLAYRSAFALDPTDLTAGLALTGALLRQKRPADAKAVALQLFRIRQEDANVWLLLAYAEHMLGNLSDARQAYESALRFNSHLRGAYGGLAAIAVSSQDTAELVRVRRRMVSIDPQSIHVWLDLADAYVADKRPLRALAILRPLHEENPVNGDILAWKGFAMAAYGRTREALTMWQQALRQQPTNPAWIHTAMGDLYLALQYHSKAVGAYRAALGLVPGEARWRGQLGVALKDSGNFADAMDIFVKLRDEFPEDPFAWRQVGFVHGYLGESAKAIPAYRKSLELDPGQGKVLMALLEAHHRLGDREEVRRIHRQLLDIDRAYAEQAYRNFIQPYEKRP